MNEVEIKFGQQPALNSKKEFTENLKREGFVWMSNEKFNTTRLYNKFSGSYPANDYIPMQYAKFCKREELPKEDEISAYVKASLDLVTGTIFIPDGAEIVNKYGSNWINTYRKYSATPSLVEIHLFHEYLQRLFPDDLDRSICVSWLSHLFQKPAERPSWHLLWSSDPGTGKGFMVGKILNPLLAQQSSVICEYGRIIGKFSTLLSNNMLVLLDDPKSKSDSTATQLKSLLSEERAHVERKGLEGSMVDTYTRFILASNENRPLRLDSDERRWYAPVRMTHKIDKAETQEFLAKLNAALELPGYLDSIHDFFMTYDISLFNHKHVEQSKTLLEMIGLSENSADYLFKDIVENHNFITQKQVKELFDENHMTSPSDPHIAHAFGSLGFAKKQLRNDSGSKIWVWCNANAKQADYNQHVKQATTPLHHPF